jgi:hypothetical protein
MKKIINNIEVDLTAQELAEYNLRIEEENNNRFSNYLNQLREIRNNILSKTDWYVTKAKENNEEIPANIKTYRQELRDLTEGLTTVEQIVNIIKNDLYPEKPEGIN